MSNNEQFQTPEEYARDILTQTDALLEAALDIVGQPGQDPLQVFPRPATSVRAEGPELPGLSDEAKSKLLEAAQGLGFGRAEDVTLSERGLVGAAVLFEGGLLAKIESEGRVVVNDTAARPSMLIFSADPHREVTDGERQSAQRILGAELEPGATEYGIATLVARKMPNFVAHQQPVDIGFSYDIAHGYAVSQGQSGQFMVIGEADGVPVVMMRIDSQDPPQGGRRINRPTGADVIAIVDTVLRGNGDTTSPIAQVTSGAYEPSRRVNAALASLSVGRPVGLATYGNDTINDVRGTNTPPPIDQLPTELYVTAEQANNLRAALPPRP